MDDKQYKQSIINNFFSNDIQRHISSFIGQTNYMNKFVKDNEIEIYDKAFDITDNNYIRYNKNNVLKGFEWEKLKFFGVEMPLDDYFMECFKVINFKKKNMEEIKKLT